MTLGTKVNHPSLGEGVIFGESDTTWRVFFKENGEEKIGKAYEGMTVMEVSELETTKGVSLEDVVNAVQSVFDGYYDVQEIVELGDKWEGGTMVLQPGEAGLSNKEIPIETFFHKIVMMRDRLRVLEQNINSHKALTVEEKVSLQQYITRIYGSMTSFNALFKSKNDYFVGEKKT
ncbi:MAG: hypothetical protein ACJAX8_000667 [Flavobacteriales bacterium]|jgi:hypothetical protein